MANQEFSATRNDDVDVAAILTADSLDCHFQPIYSIKERKMIGVEALARATDPISGGKVPPSALFEAASRQGRTLELDRLCRKRAIERFSPLAVSDPDLFVFVNLDVSVLDDDAAGSNGIIDTIAAYGVPANRVVIEIIESRVCDQAALLRFMAEHRKRGFLIALDDMGAGHSNLERIPTIKPDIVKLDRSLIAGIDKEFYKQELFDFFIKLAHKIGVMVIAEGVETREEAIACLERGADLMQGFFFARPRPLERTYEPGLANAREVGDALKEYVVARFAERKSQYKHYRDISISICETVGGCSDDEYDDLLAVALSAYPEAECAYVLDSRGIQVSSIVFNPKRAQESKRALFSSVTAGTDLSAKDYFIFLDGNQKRFVTDPYVSKASGNICVTISNLIEKSPRGSIVLCVDIDLPVPA